MCVSCSRRKTKSYAKDFVFHVVCPKVEREEEEQLTAPIVSELINAAKQEPKENDDV